MSALNFEPLPTVVCYPRHDEISAHKSREVPLGVAARLLGISAEELALLIVRDEVRSRATAAGVVVTLASIRAKADSALARVAGKPNRRRA